MQSCDLQLAAGTAQQHRIAWKVAEVLVLTHEQWSQQVAWQHVMHTRQTRSNGWWCFQSKHFAMGLSPRTCTKKNALKVWPSKKIALNLLHFEMFK